MDRFVPVQIDFPHDTRAVQDARRNDALAECFFRQLSYPRVLLTDTNGRPYTVVIGYPQEDADEYVANLESQNQERKHRDENLAAMETASGMAKLRLAEAALKSLAKQVEHQKERDGTCSIELVDFYAPLLKQWQTLAQTHDPDNSAGYRERFFYADWGRRYSKARREAGSGAAGFEPLAKEFDAWHASCAFKDPYFGSDLAACQADLLKTLDDQKGATRIIRDALRIPKIAETSWQKALYRMLPPRSGFGFGVAPGYVITNYQLVDGPVDGPGRVKAVISGKHDVTCTVEAYDEVSFLALLKLGRSDWEVTTVRLTATTTVGEGTKVATLGSALNPIQGTVRRKQEESGGQAPLLLLDLQLDAGNSGGPLFDGSGNVVGMVANETFNRPQAEHYGIAVSAVALDKFLREKLKTYVPRPSRAMKQKQDWEEISRQIKGCVVKVIKEPP
jgi:S1-C subfamily serine protease